MADIKITRTGYGYVEPNFLSAPRTGQVRGDLPAADDIEILMNGQFVKRDTVAGEVNFTGAGNWWMVFNEEKLYDERKQSHKDYAMKKADFVDGIMVPRIIKLIEGDTFTTNTFAQDTELSVGDYLEVGSDGFLVKKESGVSELRVVKCYTMPDMEPGVKIEVLG